MAASADAVDGTFDTTVAGRIGSRDNLIPPD